MKKAFFVYFLSVALIIGMVCSCSTGPNYGKLIPKDAAVVVSFNIEKAIESSGMEGEDEPQEVLEKVLKKSDFSRATREKLEEIIDDPDEAGLDLREPLMLFYSSTYKNEAGLTGAVYDAQKLEDLVNVMAREALCNKVNTYGELRYSIMGNMVLAFNDSWFFVTEKKSNQMNEEAVLDEIEGLFLQDEEKSLYGTEVYEKMSAGEGFFQILLQGEGLEDMLQKYPDFKQMMAGLPSDFDLSDIAYICDLSMNKGEILFSGETVLLTDEAEKWLEKYNGYGQIAGDFNSYISPDAILRVMSNVNGVSVSKQMAEQPDVMKALDRMHMDFLPELLAGVKGDCAFYINGMIRHSDFPEMGIYVQTENADWLKYVLPKLPQEPECVGKNEYSLALYENPDAQMANLAPEAYAKFGTRGEVSYLLVGKSPDPFYKEKEIQHLGDGKNVYMRLNISDLADMGIFKDAMGRMESMVMKQVASPFDYAEMYLENKTKTTFRIVMKDKDEYPVKTVYDEVFKLLKHFL